MARPQNQKRRRTRGSLQENASVKKAKFSSKHNFSPTFWDNLSKVSLTPRALRELDRRNNSLPTVIPEVYPTELARFARHWGPDLRHLQGVQLLILAELLISRSWRPQSTSATSVGSRSGRSSAYGKDFQQHLADYNVHVNNRRSKALNATEVQSELAHERASLSPSQFSESDFEEFCRKNEDSAFESEVITSVLPILWGNSSIHNKQNVLFTELEPITNSGAIKPKPDFFDGARLGDLDQNIRNDEGILSAAIPTKHPNVPVVPNFFLEVKGPDGNASVAQRQACYDGAHGTRAIHALQNYKETEPIYDGNAYTYSSTYHAGTGTLQLYAHHVTAPATVNKRPEYHMTHIDGWQMTGNINSFRRGATAFRNAGDSAQRHRNHFIQAANAKATQATSAQEKFTGRHEDLNNSTPHDSREDPAYTTLQDADDALQQQLAIEDEAEDEEAETEAETEAISSYVNEGSLTSGQEFPTRKAPMQKRSRLSTSPRLIPSIPREITSKITSIDRSQLG